MENRRAGCVELEPGDAVVLPCVGGYGRDADDAPTAGSEQAGGCRHRRLLMQNVLEGMVEHHDVDLPRHLLERAANHAYRRRSFEYRWQIRIDAGQRVEAGIGKGAKDLALAATNVEDSRVMLRAQSLDPGMGW